VDDDKKVVRVADMYYGCTYQVPSNSATATTRCLRMAYTDVEFPDGTLAWRCDEHRGLTEGVETGLVSETMLTTLHVPEKIVLSRPQR